MPYGTIKVDNITFTNGGSDTTITVSGLASSTTGNLTVTGTISGAIVRATTVSGVTVTGTTVQGASGTFTSITGQVATITSGVFAAGSATNPSISFTGDNNTGIYSPGADQVAISTNGTGRLFVDASGRVGVGTTPSTVLHCSSTDAVLTLQGTRGTGATASIGTGGTNSQNLVITAGTDLYQRGATHLFQNVAGTTEYARITSAGLVGVGTSSPVFLTDILSGTANTGANVNNPSQLSVTGPNKSLTAGGATVFINSNSDLAIDTGGSIALSGRNTTSSTNSVVWGVVKGAKENATSGNTAGYLAFASANHAAGSLVEAMRIDSSQRVGIGTSSPAARLHIASSSGSPTSVAAGGLRIYETTNNYGINIGGDGTSAYLQGIRGDTGTLGYNNIVLNPNGGSVGIGTTSPTFAAGGGVQASFATFSSFRATSGSNTGTDFAAASDGKGYVYVRDNADLLIGTNNTERARVDSSGRLLVGTSSASDNNALLKVQSNVGGSTGTGWVDIRRGLTTPGSGSQLGLLTFSDASGNNYASIDAYVDATPGTNDYPGRLVFSTTADGASSPSERVTIYSTGYTRFLGQNVTVTRMQRNGGIGTVIELGIDGNTPGTISCTTTATSYNTSSDYRLKENVELVADGIIRLQQLKPSRFNFIADPDKTVDGFIAHEVQTIVPEAITGTKDAVDEDGNPIYQGIDQSKLVPLLTAALQEAIGRIETLEAEVAALKAQ